MSEVNIMLDHGKAMQKIGVKYALEIAKIDPDNIVAILEDKLDRLDGKITVEYIKSEVTLGTQNGIDYHVYPSETR